MTTFEVGELIYDDLSGRVAEVAKIGYDNKHRCVIVMLKQDPKVLKFKEGWRKSWEVTTYAK